MQLKLVALSTLVASVVAEPAATTSGVPALPASAAAILLSVLPSSAIAYVESNPAGFATHVASEFKAGETPGWFTKLPTKLQSELLGDASAASASAGTSSSSPAASGSNSPPSASSGMSISTGPGPESTGSGASTSSSAAASSPSSSSSTSVGGAAAPTAIFGAGVMGAMGIIGVLAL